MSAILSHLSFFGIDELWEQIYGLYFTWRSAQDVMKWNLCWWNLQISTLIYHLDVYVHVMCTTVLNNFILLITYIFDRIFLCAYYTNLICLPHQNINTGKGKNWLLNILIIKFIRMHYWCAFLIAILSTVLCFAFFLIQYMTIREVHVTYPQR
jgi:hypothetical protein